MKQEPQAPTRRNELRDVALGACFALFVLALIASQLRSTYRDFRLLDRGTPSFAYVTRARANWASKNGPRGDRCELEALLPREPQARAPQTLPDMTAARYFTSNEPDGDRTCLDQLHTWQPVLFDPNDRSHARFASGLHASVSQAVALAVLFVAIALVMLLVRALRRLRARRAR